MTKVNSDDSGNRCLMTSVLRVDGSEEEGRSRLRPQLPLLNVVGPPTTTACLLFRCCAQELPKTRR